MVNWEPFGEKEGSAMEQKSPIYDMSIREIEMVVMKLEADNINLRRELHECRVKLNERDEEILKLGRERLSEKKELLNVTKKVMTLTEAYKMGQVQALNQFLLNLYVYNDGEETPWQSLECGEQVSSEEQQLLATTTAATGSNIGCSGPVWQKFDDNSITVQLPAATPMSKKPAEYSPVDEMVHVKSPFGYQYRHLKLQVQSDDDGMEQEYDDAENANGHAEAGDVYIDHVGESSGQGAT